MEAKYEYGDGEQKIPAQDERRKKERSQMSSKYGCNMVANMWCGAELSSISSTLSLLSLTIKRNNTTTQHTKILSMPVRATCFCILSTPTMWPITAWDVETGSFKTVITVTPVAGAKRNFPESISLAALSVEGFFLDNEIQNLYPRLGQMQIVICLKNVFHALEYY